MNNDPIGPISNVEKGLGGINRQLDSTITKLQKLVGLASSTFTGIKQVMGTGVGQGTPLALGTSNAQFSNGTGASATNNNMPWAYSPKGAATIGGVQLALGVAGAGYAALPGLADVMPRTVGRYQAMARMPGVSAATLQSMSFNAIKGGITGRNEDIAAMNMLVNGYGMIGKANFTQSMQEVKGAALGYGMANATAAQAIGSMHTGATSGSLYQYGISTLDVKTGKTRPMDQIAKQIYSLVMGNRKLTPAQLEFSMREGTLNKTINDLVTDPAANQIVRNMMTPISQGKDASLLNQTGSGNPLTNTAYKIATSQASVADATAPGLTKGYELAATGIAKLNKSLEGTPESILKMKGAIDAVANSNLGSAISSLVSGITGAIATIAGAALLRGAVGRATASAAAQAAESTGSKVVVRAGGIVAKKVATKGAVTAAEKVAGKVALGAAGKAVPILGGAYAGYTGQGFLQSVGTSAAVAGAFGAMAGPEAIIPAAVIGGTLDAVGWIGGNLVKSFKSMMATSNNAPTTAGPNQSGLGLPTNADQTLVNELSAAGFSGQSLITAYGVAKAESGGNASAYNPTGLDKSYGLFQINMENNDPRNPNMGKKRNDAYLKKYKSIGYTGPESLKDPNINAKIAFDLSKGGTNFDPWSTYKSGSYLNQLTPGGTATAAGPQTVNVYLTISKASDAEAVAFAKKVKDILSKDKTLSAIGSK